MVKPNTVYKHTDDDKPSYIVLAVANRIVYCLPVDYCVSNVIQYPLNYFNLRFTQVK